MWRASVLTIFPEMFPGALGMSLAGKALAAGTWALDVVDIRAHATDKHRTVDDTPAGGGPGMVMKADVLARALDAASSPDDVRPRLLMSPRGMPLTQARVATLSRGPGAVILCGRFEGVDERIIEGRNVSEVSIGDYVLSGGEVAAFALIDACVRAGPARIPAIHAAPALRGQGHPRSADLRRPRQGRGLAPGRGRAADPRAPAGPVGGLPGAQEALIYEAFWTPVIEIDKADPVA